MVLAMYRVHSSMQGTDGRRIVLHRNESRCCVIVELYLEVEDVEIEFTGSWVGESKIPESIV